MSNKTRRMRKKRAAKFYYFNRQGEGPGKPPGITVSKNPELPAGEFRITEYVWTHLGYNTFWFIDADKFTADERQAAYEQYVIG